MKVFIYFLQINKQWQWKITIEPRVDFAYWFNQYQEKVNLIWIDPMISLGQAMGIGEDFTKEKVKLEKQKEQIKSNISEPYEKQYAQTMVLIGKVLKNIDQSKTKLFKQIKFSMRNITYHEWLNANFRMNASIVEEARYLRFIFHLQGRALLISELERLVMQKQLFENIESAYPYIQWGYLCGHLHISQGLIKAKRRFWRSFWKISESHCCLRCGSNEKQMNKTDCHHCLNGCFYCEACMSMGKNRFCSLVVYGQYVGKKVNLKQSMYNGYPIALENTKRLFEMYVEPYYLSEAQRNASLQGLAFLNTEQRKFLIWAVTGAGKTEMIFPFIKYICSQGGKVLIATPRKDVVLELYPRIKKAFDSNAVIALYGGSEQVFETADITIATTHQLFRFKKAFHLAIIDEMDAFPYHNNPMLEYAVNQVVTDNGKYILLTATPPLEVRKAVQSGKLPHTRVPVRFHRYPLPVPEFIYSPCIETMLSHSHLQNPILQKMKISIHRNAQLFIFVPAIKDVKPFVELIRKNCKKLNPMLDAQHIEGTSSMDPERTEKVQLFRDTRIRLLVTTTILERGVTIPFADVYIFDADSTLFDEAALVQMAGRAGRSKEDPAGKVYFFAKEITKPQSNAKKQIITMNEWAKRSGYLLT
jgi:competence protein ComFA